MIAWQITENGVIQQINIKESLEDLTKSKIKITKSLLDNYVVEAFKGLNNSILPLIPNSFSVGIVSDFGNNDVYDFEKGSRVYISALNPCSECFDCVTNNEIHCSNMKFLGRNTDGVLKDFVIVPNNQIFALPPSVEDEDALLIDFIALYITAIDKLDINKGEHVLVIGNGIQSLITCQIISYYKSIPILVTNDEKTYNLAEKLGIFYKYNTYEDLVTEVSCLTGGRMTHNVLYLTDSKIDTEYISKLSSNNAKVVLCGFDNYNINLSLSTIMNKQLDLSCVKNGYGETKSAINLLANKAIDTSEYNLKEIRFSEVEKILTNTDENTTFFPYIVTGII